MVSREQSERLAARAPAARHPSPPLGLEGLAINVAAAMHSLRQNVLRSALTILGVVIGAASVITLVALASGAQREVTSQIDGLGANVAIIVPGKMPGEPNYNPVAGGAVSTLTEDDARQLQSLDGVLGVAPLIFVLGAIQHGGKAPPISLPIATTASYLVVRHLKVETGRFFTDSEQDSPVCAIGVAIRDALFPGENPVGQTLTVGGQEYRVVGVVSQRSVSSSILGGKELDAIVYLPLRFARREKASTIVHRIFVEVDSRRPVAPMLERLKSTLIANHGGQDDFSVLTSKELLGMFHKMFRIFAALLIGITSISLIVGGIGIMNIMLVSVTERTREIGIRKTVGARRRDIFVQFLTEAVTLSVLGGLIGVVVAGLACWLTGLYSPLRPEITPLAILEGVGVCVAVGIIFGVLPASQAARKTPVDAMRYE